MKVVVLLVVFIYVEASSKKTEVVSTNSEKYTDSGYGSDPRPYSSNPLASKVVPNDFKVVQKLLLEERSASKLYNTIWGKAETLYLKKKQELPAEYFKSSTPNECYIAVMAYTLAIPVKVDGKFLKLYQDFNQRFRALTDEASWERFPYKSFYYLLVKAVPGIKNDPSPSRDMYRGIKGFHFTPTPKVGDTFYFDYFGSCTTDRAIAERFAGSDGTLLEIQGGVNVAIGIDKYSTFSEKEVLVFPSNKFRVKKFTRRGTHDLLVLERKL